MGIGIGMPLSNCNGELAVCHHHMGMGSCVPPPYGNGKLCAFAKYTNIKMYATTLWEWEVVCHHPMGMGSCMPLPYGKGKLCAPAIYGNKDVCQHTMGMGSCMTRPYGNIKIYANTLWKWEAVCHATLWVWEVVFPCSTGMGSCVPLPYNGNCKLCATTLWEWGVVKTKTEKVLLSDCDLKSQLAILSRIYLILYILYITLYKRWINKTEKPDI